jgi:hypothetical protein
MVGAGVGRVAQVGWHGAGFVLPVGRPAVSWTIGGLVDGKGPSWVLEAAGHACRYEGHGGRHEAGRRAIHARPNR